MDKQFIQKRVVVLGLVGSKLDVGRGHDRWARWRPTVALGMHEDLRIDRIELLHHPAALGIAESVHADLALVSPETRVVLTPLAEGDPWDFEATFERLHDFVRGYPFDPEREDYLVHLTTGTHVEQICLFLLTESRHLPGRLLQLAPPRASVGGPGRYTVVDLDLSRYDRLAARFAVERHEGLSLLKQGLETRNPAFNALMTQLERVATATRAPILLTGPTGAGKSQLARRIYEVKRARHQTRGPLVEVNCATLRGDGAMSALFGHTRGAFTGAVQDRPGLLRQADGGVLFLDEVGELGLDEQAMLLRALEEGRFLPVGADREVESTFQLLAGTNRTLDAQVRSGHFREDLLARIDLWHFRLPGLRERPEDLEPNLTLELDRAGRALGHRVTFSREARETFLRFGTSAEALWTGNFRDLGAAVLRMATLAPGGRIDEATVQAEVGRLRARWRGEPTASTEDAVAAVLGHETAEALDRFDRAQLAFVLQVCRSAESLSAAGRHLFQASRARKASSNDADRLRKYLARFGLEFERVRVDAPTVEIY